MKKECKLTDHRVGHDWRDLAAAAAGKVEDFKDRASCIHCGELFPKEDSLKQKEERAYEACANTELWGGKTGL